MIACTTLERVKLLGKVQDTTDDALLTSLIEDVSEAVQSALGRDLDSGTAHVTYLDQSEGKTRWQLRGFPIALTPAPVVERDETRAWSQGTVTALEPGLSYAIDYEQGLLVVDEPSGRTLEDWQRGGSAVIAPAFRRVNTLRVTYTGGMAGSDIEFVALYGSLARGVDEEVLKLYRRRDTAGIRSQTVIGSTSTTYDSSEFNDGLREAISRHRILAYQ